MGTNGWPFRRDDDEESIFPAADPDPLYHSAHVKDLYFRADPEYSARFTVPVLWDKKLHTIVNNESSEIIRMFNTAFNEELPADKAALDLYPESLRAEIDEVNAWVYDDINNGVYKSGFATSSDAYRAAVVKVFAALDRVESMLDGKTYLVGDRLTEADVRLFVTIVRRAGREPYRPISNQALRLDSLRPCICRSLQMQLEDYPPRIPGNPSLAAPPLLG